MNPLVILPGYLTWHYSKAFKQLLNTWGNFIWFTLHFFSVPTLALTLFSPWRRLRETYHRGFDPGDFFGTLLVNIIMRFVGAVIRFMFIIIGLFFFSVVLIFGMAFFLFWLVAPVGVFLAVAVGITLLGV